MYNEPVNKPCLTTVASTSAGVQIARLLLLSCAMLAVFGLSIAVFSWLQSPERQPLVLAQREVTPRGDLLPAEQSVIEVFSRCAPSVVHVTSVSYRRVWGRVQQRAVGTGSGFVWDKSGHIVTNLHVVLTSNLLPRLGSHVANITFGRDATRQYKAVLVGYAKNKDLAVLKVIPGSEPGAVDLSLLQPVQLGRSENLLVGQSTLAIGNPFGLDQTLTTGVVSALGREIESVSRTTISDVIQTDAAINPGNSGGPLFDSAGRLIGVNTAIYSPSGAYAGIGFAIPVDTVRHVVPDLISYGKIKRPRLGIETREHLDRQIGLPGIMVWGVAAGTGAEKAGLRSLRTVGEDQVEFGDLIVAIEGRKVRSMADLISVLEDYKVGREVEVELLRQINVRRDGRVEGRREKVKITLSAEQE